MNDPSLTLEDIRRLEYVGGGYFRMPGPKGQKTVCLHGPELLNLFIQLMEKK